MFSKILVVCVGNICRSPAAEGLLRHLLSEKGGNISVSSAGISALVGKSAHDKASELMKKTGVDLTSHKARQLDAALVHDHDLILVMEEGHVKAVEALVPSARGKVHLLGKWRQGVEIPDPYRKGDAAFEHAHELIESTVADWVKKLCR
ncbi:MAG: low molecular weight protein-tyrosine-phosphatase [Endozoicomonas sp.]